MDAVRSGERAAGPFGGDAPQPADEQPAFEAVHCTRGSDGVTAVEAAIAAGRPFCVVFVDVRMPPGIDGRETARRIRARP